MTPLPGDFCVRSMGGDAGKLISLGEFLNGNGFSEYDHAEIFVGLPDSHAPYGYTMGAYPGGAHLVPLAYDQLNDGNGFLWSTGKIPLTDIQRAAIVKNALACQGIGYGWLDYFALAAHRLHIPVPGLREFIASSKTLICSQLVDHVDMLSGVHLFSDGRWPGYVTPASLAGFLE